MCWNGVTLTHKIGLTILAIIFFDYMYDRLQTTNNESKDENDLIDLTLKPRNILTQNLLVILGFTPWKKEEK